MTACQSTASAASSIVCLNKVSLPSNQKYRFDLPTKPTPLQARAFELLGVGLPM